MRSALFVLSVAITTAACDGKPLVGPDAQRAVAQAQSEHLNFLSDSGPLFFLDGVRMGPDSRDIDPATIASVQIVKGTVATSKYGPSASRGVVLITTKHFAAQHRSH